MEIRWECDGDEMEMKFEDRGKEEWRIFGSGVYKKKSARYEMSSGRPTNKY